MHCRCVSPACSFSLFYQYSTEVCMKDIGAFRGLLLQNPVFARGIIEALNRNLDSAIFFIALLVKKTSPGRTKVQALHNDCVDNNISTGLSVFSGLKKTQLSKFKRSSF